jgi:hypothetical protein
VSVRPFTEPSGQVTLRDIRTVVSPVKYVGMPGPSEVVKARPYIAGGEAFNRLRIYQLPFLVMAILYEKNKLY